MKLKNKHTTVIFDNNSFCEGLVEVSFLVGKKYSYSYSIIDTQIEEFIEWFERQGFEQVLTRKEKKLKKVEK